MKISTSLFFLFLVLTSCLDTDSKQDSRKTVTKIANIHKDIYSNSNLNLLIKDLLLKSYENPINTNDWALLKKSITQTKNTMEYFTQQAKVRYDNNHVLLHLSDGIGWVTVGYIDSNFICFLADNGKFLIVDFKNNLYLSFNFLGGQSICIENLEYIYLLDRNFFPYLRITENIYQIFHYERFPKKISANIVYFEKAYHKNILSMNYKDLIKIKEQYDTKKYQLSNQFISYNEIFFEVPIWVEY